MCGDGLRTLLTPAVVADDDLNGSAVGGGLQSLLSARRARDSTPALAPEGVARFYGEVLPAMQRLALRIAELFPDPQATHSIPLMLPQHHTTVTLTQEECGSLLSNSFFGTLWHRPSLYNPGVGFPQFDLQTLVACGGGPGLSTLRCLLHYFERLALNVPEGSITFRRHFLSRAETSDWATSDRPLRRIVVEPKANLEDSPCPYLVDFANAYVGGGTLTGACMQEEILFATRPECLVSLLFCSRLEDNEVLCIKGAERYSLHSGYGHTFKWKADHSDATPRDDKGRRERTLVVMDAEQVSGAIHDWKLHVDRDLRKAYAGFHFAVDADEGEEAAGPIATGNWGCGAFGGDKSLKVMQQMMAASQAGRDLVYHAFGTTYRGRLLAEWIDELQGLVAARQLTVGELYRAIIEATPGTNLFQVVHTAYAGQ